MLESHGDRLYPAADALIALLRQKNRKIVFAESCTAGLIAATLGRTPGISDYLCGSAVVYRNATKSEWLDVSEHDLADPAVTAVSHQVAEAMAIGVLAKTPEADLSASITGYLGPDSPPDQDRLAYVGVAARDSEGITKLALVRKIQLTDRPDRLFRQYDAAAQVLEMVAEVMSGHSLCG